MALVLGLFLFTILVIEFLYKEFEGYVYNEMKYFFILKANDHYRLYLLFKFLVFVC